ncbi:magnesium chelatase subunit H [Rhabdaerophilum sp. SD176]|uniref:magnesium chelatase subunit H n=1 Tax=Rhabdaerophilum sp. SD176 TaxID=2983548 RepID=UPI0024DF5D68|nr:magnesium chelatase subunit H [Rhabdaerophilum sp. SD176]
MQKRISDADPTPIRVVIVTMDDHLTGAIARTRPRLRREMPGLVLQLHSAAEWGRHPEALARCRADIAQGDIIIGSMLFMEEQYLPILDALQARRPHCDAMVACMSAPEIVRLTRMGSYDMSAPVTGFAAFLKKLRGNTKGGTGAHQMKMLRRIPQILKYIPGAAQDIRAYFLTMQYWLAGSEDNALNLVRFLVSRYAAGPRQAYRNGLKAALPVEYPEIGVYHPALPGRIADKADALPSRRDLKGVIGLLVMRSYLLAGNTAHYDGVIAAIEARGYRVIPAFASGLDARPAIEQYFMRDGQCRIDAMVSLTGFSLVGGPAYNDAEAAEAMLRRLDVPYIAAHAVEFQSLQEWGASDRGLLPVEATIMVAIPELDGATGSIVFGGRADPSAGACTGCARNCRFEGASDDRPMQSCPDRAEMLAARLDKLVALRQTRREARKVGIVIFNFPPNAGNTGTAAYLGVFESLFNTLRGLAEAGYRVEMPDSVDTLRKAIVEGNASRFCAPANVHHRIPLSDHVRRETWLGEIEKQWGPAPGRQQTDGASLFVLGARFGDVFVGVQPSFGYEGDPMRLLFEKGFAPTHAFSAFYRWLREDFGANAVLHFGTHGALEFMPGKQTGLSGSSWPDRLIGDLPNVYLYASNNPSEGALAKRRSAATLLSYLTPPVAHAGLYRGLLDLKASIDRWRSLAGGAEADRSALAELIQSQAAAVDLVPAEPLWPDNHEAEIRRLGEKVLELEYALIPHGLHVVGEPMDREARIEMLAAMADAGDGWHPSRAALERLADGDLPDAEDANEAASFAKLSRANGFLSADSELPAILQALEGRFIAPAQGGDVLRTPTVLPTGRNLHSFDPFRIPSAYARLDGARQAEKLLARHAAEGHGLPRKVALVLWGADNVKTEGGPIAQALALMGAEPRFDGYGRLVGAQLVPLETLGRPRIDVMMTLSGIFRDLLPLQTRLLAEAAYLAASAEEPEHLNFIRAHALAYQAEHGCDLETAALRVFSNADGAYGSNVNHLVENGKWQEEDELAETYSRRKCFAYGRQGNPNAQPALLNSMLGRVELTYQNLESVEVGVTSLDQYFDTLGGISKAASRARGGASVPVYIGDQTRGDGLVRTLGEQVALEARSRVLNPKWYEGMLKHGYEGVRQIEEHVRNTMGWSATTGQVAPWVYKQITATFVLDPEMRERMAELNPVAAAKVAQRLIEAHERNYWQPDAETLDALRNAEETLEDRIEGVGMEVAA